MGRDVGEELHLPVRTHLGDDLVRSNRTQRDVNARCQRPRRARRVSGHEPGTRRADRGHVEHHRTHTGRWHTGSTRDLQSDGSGGRQCTFAGRCSIDRGLARARVEQPRRHLRVQQIRRIREPADDIDDHVCAEVGGERHVAADTDFDDDLVGDGLAADVVQTRCQWRGGTRRKHTQEPVADAARGSDVEHHRGDALNRHSATAEHGQVPWGRCEHHLASAREQPIGGGFVASVHQATGRERRVFHTSAREPTNDIDDEVGADVGVEADVTASTNLGDDLIRNGALRPRVQTRRQWSRCPSRVNGHESIGYGLH